MRRLYTGLTPPDEDMIHCPFIQIIPRPPDDPLILKMRDCLPRITHMIFTSKSAVQIFFDWLPKGFSLSNVHAFAVGRVTASYLESRGFQSIAVPSEETAEGVIQLIDSKDLSDPFFLWPHSARSRPLISNYLKSRNFPFYNCILYDTITLCPDPLPNLTQFDEVILTSPSTVEGFLKAYAKIPDHLRLIPIGPITAKFLNTKYK